MPIDNWIAAKVSQEVAHRLAEMAGYHEDAKGHVNFSSDNDEQSEEGREQVAPRDLVERSIPSRRQTKIRSGRQGRKQYNGRRRTNGMGRNSFVSAVYAGTDPNTGQPKDEEVFQGPYGPLGTPVRDTASDKHTYTNDPQSYGGAYVHGRGAH